MSENSTYKINFGHLTIGKHKYEYVLDKDFFGQELASFASDCSSTTVVTLDKSSQILLNIDFEISGSANLSCDRCLDTFSYPISTKNTLVVKLADNEESTDEIVFLPTGSYEIDLTQYIYEFHLLSLPFKRTCDLVEKQCDSTIVDRLGNGGQEDNNDTQTDPRWDILKNLQ